MPRARPALALLALSLQLALACEPQPPATPPPPPGVPPAPPAPPSPADTTPPPQPPAPEAGPTRWLDFPGPKLEVSLTGPTNWAVVPVGEGWDVLKFALYDWVRAEGAEQVFRLGDQEIWVPGAFTRQAEPPAALKKGSPVVFSGAASALFGRVVATGQDEIRVRYAFGGEVDEKSVAPREVVLLEGKPAFGEPAAYKEGDTWNTAQLVHAGADTTWLVGFAGKRLQVPSKDVKPLAVTKVYRKGEAVWAARLGILRPGKVLEALDQGLRYTVVFEGKDRETVTFAGVTAPL